MLTLAVHSISQYMHARVCSILRKLGVDAHALLKADACVPVDLGHKSEMELACCLMRFQDAVEAVLAGLVPHRMCEYLYDLAGHFSKFFRDCRVLDNGVVNERWGVVLAVVVYHLLLL